MSKESAEAALREYAEVTADRDNRIRQAYTEGITKNRIHTITGIARTTIDRILEENRVTITKITAICGGPWARSANAWVEAARNAGHTAEVVEGEHAENHCPVVLVDGDHYVLNRYSDRGIVVHVDYKAAKNDRGWVPTR